MTGWIRSRPEIWGWLAAGSVLLVLIYAGIIFLAAVMVSPGYFLPPRPAPGTLRGERPVVRLAARVLKNLVGFALLLAGIALLILPGQGLLTIALALAFLDFPGKRRLLATIVTRTRVLEALNAMRRRAGRDPLLPPPGYDRHHRS